MADEITEGEIKVDGLVIANTGLLIASKRPWHDKGSWLGDGKLTEMPQAIPGYNMLGRVNMWLEAVYAQLGDEMVYTGHGIIVRQREDEDDAPVFIGRPVPTGNIENYFDPDNPNKTPGEPWLPRVTDLMEIIPPEVFVRNWQNIVRDENGHPLKLESIGYLGKKGSKGMFLVAKLPSITADGHEVERYLTAWNPNGMGNSVLVWITHIHTVCMNTLIMGLQRSTQLLKVSHHKGAEQRMQEAAATVYGNAMAAAKLEQAAIDLLAQTPVTEDQIAEITTAVFTDPARPNPNRKTKLAWQDRIKAFEYHVNRNQKMRDGVLKIYREYADLAGITENTKGTAWGAWQAFTFLATHMPTTAATTSWDQTVYGWRGGVIRDSFDGLMKVADPGYQPQDRVWENELVEA